MHLLLYKSISKYNCKNIAIAIVKVNKYIIKPLLEK